MFWDNWSLSRQLSCCLGLLLICRTPNYTHARRDKPFCTLRIVHFSSAKLLEYMLQYPKTMASSSRKVPKKKENPSQIDYSNLVLRLCSALCRRKINHSSTNVLQWFHHYLTDSSGFQNYSQLNRFSSWRKIGFEMY